MGSFVMKCVVLLLLCVAFAVAQNSTCGFEDSAGNSYDLSDLSYDPSQLSPDGYNGVDQNQQAYFINFCQQVSTVDSRTTGCSKSAPAAACQDSGGNIHNAGLVSQQVFSSAWSDANAPVKEGNYTSGISVTYSGGDACPNVGSGVTRSTTINVACNPDVEKGDVYSAYDNSKCGYQVYYSSSLACVGGSGGGVNPGWIIIFIVCIFFFVFVQKITCGKVCGG